MQSEIEPQISFENVALTKRERLLLASIEHDGTYCTAANQQEIRRLEHLKFVMLIPVGDPISGTVIPKHMPDGSTILVFLTDLGRDYIIYAREKEFAEKKNKRHDLFVAFIGAIAGAIIIVAAQAMIA